MSDSLEPEARTVRIVRRLPATPERLFRAWTVPSEILGWWQPFAGTRAVGAELDLRVGGRLRITLENASAQRFAVVGVFEEIDPPRRLVYTWLWEGLAEAPSQETRVRVDFRAVSGGTELVLRHGPFPDPEDRASHLRGWEGILDRLLAFSGESVAVAGIPHPAPHG